METVRPGETGILVPPRTASRLAEATLSLLRDDSLRARLGAGARSEAEGRSWSTIMDGLLDSWHEVVDGHPGSGTASPLPASSAA